MFGRKKQKSQDEAAPALAAEAPVPEQPAAPAAAAEPAQPDSDPASDRADGPFDIAEVPDLSLYLDVGALKVRALPDVALRLEVDKATNKPAAVTMVKGRGAVQLRAFAAPRSGGLWEKSRADILQQVASAGGQAKEVDGAFGVEVQAAMPVQSAEGEAAGLQPMRFVGVSGPRWMLQGVFMGEGAVPDAAGDLDAALRSVVVDRGEEAMPVGAVLPLVMPEQPGQEQPPAEPTGPTAEDLEPGARITETR